MTPSERAEAFCERLTSEGIIFGSKFRLMLCEMVEEAEADAIQRTKEETDKILRDCSALSYRLGRENGIQRTRDAVKSGISAKLSEYSKDGNARYLLGLKDAFEICMTVEVR